jgi:hypothetical protein
VNERAVGRPDLRWHTGHRHAGEDATLEELHDVVRAFRR